MTSVTEHPKPKAKKFILIETRRLHEFVEDLNTSSSSSWRVMAKSTGHCTAVAGADVKCFYEENFWTTRKCYKFQEKIALSFVFKKNVG